MSDEWIAREAAERICDEVAFSPPMPKEFNITATVRIILSAIERATDGVNELLHEATKLLANRATYELRQAFYTKVNKFDSAAQSQRSKTTPETFLASLQPPQQECANIHIEHYFPKGYDPDAEPWKSIKTHHNAALAIERRLREQDDQLWRGRYNDAWQQLLSAQAAIEQLRNGIRDSHWHGKYLVELLAATENVDLSLLREHDEAVRKPLVNAITDAILQLTEGYPITAGNLLRDALAKVKELTEAPDL